MLDELQIGQFNIDFIQHKWAIHVIGRQIYKIAVQTTCTMSAAVDVEVEAIEISQDEGSRTPSEHSGASSPEPLCSGNEDYLCQICSEKFNTPRVLSCLHVFCSPCLEKLFEGAEGKLDAADDDDAQDAGHENGGSIACPECKQVTFVARGTEELQEDHVMMNLIDMVAIEDKQIICTSCKAKEKAVARCSDCANFLCPNCVTAHQYMRCFENHKVVSFEDLKDEEGGMSLHKPLFCKIHPSEGLKFYCKTCQALICNECMIGNHKPPEHSYDRIPDSTADNSYTTYLGDLIKESKAKGDICQELTCNLDGSLRELQMQRDNARGLIQETFQSYKAILEKRQNDLLEELEKIHSEKELSIMEIFHTIEKIIEKTEDGCKFAERILQHGNCAEILSMKKLISCQLLSLINNTPSPDINVSIEFETDAAKFELAIKETFGRYKKEGAKDAPAVSPHSSFENEGIGLPPGLLGTDGSMLPPVRSQEYIPSIPPLSLSAISAPSPGNSLNSIAASIAGLTHQTMHSIASSIQNLPSVERSSSRNSYSPAMSDSGISVDAASNSSSSNQPTLHYTSLAKLGSVSINERGQVMLNGQVIQGLSASNISGLPANMSGVRVATPTTPAADSGLAGLLSSMSMQGQTSQSQTPPPLPSTSSRSQTPTFNELASLLSQTSPPLGSLPAISGASGATSSTSSASGLLATDSKNVVLPSNTPLGIPPPTTPTFGQPQGTPVNIFGQGQSPFPARSTSKMSAMQIRCKFGQLGPGKSQFNSPHGFCLGMDEDIVVADTNNHRVQVFEKTGEFKYQFGIPGREEGQLWYPRKVAVVRHSGKYVVCDRGNERSRMQIFTKNGHFIKKIAIRYIDIVAGLAVTSQGHIVAVDSVSPTVFVIGETGDLIKWFDCSDYMREPSDIAISGKEYFVCDFKGHCVVVFNDDGQFMRRIGCENITNYPNGIDISDAGDVLVGDSHGNRFHVAVFQRDGSIIGEFECPYVKVSRCCGLKITSEGYVVTLAKNNHHVLVLNTLYIS